MRLDRFRARRVGLVDSNMTKTHKVVNKPLLSRIVSFSSIRHVEENHRTHHAIVQ